MVCLFTTNENLEAMLLGIENISLIEPIIIADAERLSMLQAVKDNLDFGEIPGKKKAAAVLHKAAAEANVFLGTEGVKMPSLLYGFADGFHYNPSNRKIIAEKSPFVELITGLSHEYAHHVQHRTIDKLNKENCWHKDFMEGHARGVERHCARKFAEEYGNPAFMLTITQNDLMEHLSAYRWMCKKHGIKENEAVARRALLLPEADRNYGLDNYAVGNAIFSICEAVHGAKIYREALGK